MLCGKRARIKCGGLVFGWYLYNSLWQPIQQYAVRHGGPTRLIRGLPLINRKIGSEGGGWVSVLDLVNNGLPVCKQPLFEHGQTFSPIVSISAIDSFLHQLS